jgi:type IV pilus assembly protein PilP
MVMTRMQIRWCDAVIVGSIALTGYLFAPIGITHAEPYPYNGEIRVAMALFGGDDQKPDTPPPKPLVPKPQAPPAQGGAVPAGPTGTGQPPAPAVQPGSAGSPAQPVPPGSAPGTPSPVKPETATPPVGAANEPPKPTGAVVAPPTVAPSSPLAEALDGYSYDPKSRRDPFQSLTKAIKKEQMLDVPPLQRYQLSDVKILGIIWGGYGYHALIQTPDGKGYTVKEGMLMGTNNGVIKTITDKAVVITEPAVDFSGKKIEKEVELLLRPKEVS